MSYAGYNVYLQYQASSPKDYFRTNLQERINRDFEDTINVYTIKQKNRLTGTFSDITVRIERYGQEYSFFAHDDYKKLIFQDIDYSIYLGDMFEFEGYRWIVIQGKTRHSTTSSCVVQKCNAILKFTETTPITENIIEIDCVVQNRIYDTQNSVYIYLPKGKAQVIAPHDPDVMKIHVSAKPTRFLLGQKDWRGKYKAWEVENMDTIGSIEIDTYASTPVEYAGSVRINLKEDSKDILDDHDIGVAWQHYF